MVMIIREREIGGDNITDRRCDAIVLYSRFIPEELMTLMINELPVPLVVMNRQLPKAPDRRTVFCPAGNGAAVTHLLSWDTAISLRITARYAYAYRKGPRQVTAMRWLDYGIRTTLIWSPTVKNLILKVVIPACQEIAARREHPALFCCTDNMAEGLLRTE